MTKRRDPNYTRPRGSFILAFHTGYKRRFKDTQHYGNACLRLSRGRFETALQLVEFAKALPNGYTSFLERTDDSS